MSNYRDDTTSTALASDSTFIGIGGLVEDFIQVSNALFFGIAITCSSSAIASDEVIDTSGYTFSESATVSDDIVDRLIASQYVYDKASVAHSDFYGLRVDHEDTAVVSDALMAGGVGSIVQDTAIASDTTVGQRIVSTLFIDTATAGDWITSITAETIEDTATASDKASDQLKAADLITATAIASDELIGSITSLIVDTATVSDEFIGRRFVSALVVDQAIAKDELVFGWQDIISDTAIGSDYISDKLSARNLLEDTALIFDEVIDSIIQSSMITDSAVISDSVIDRLYAAFSWHDTVVVQDELVSTGGYHGQTWTANVDSWAMSRYNPVNYERLVVIDNVLYGEADDGIYQLDMEVSPVVASIKTGKMDLGNGAITHPSYSYLEYELIGQASMTVSTTQKGIEQQYTYVLPNELADELTNGRFIFGRGLRGRHFSFELTMVGTHGYINDLSVDHQPTSRRV